MVADPMSIEETAPPRPAAAAGRRAAALEVFPARDPFPWEIAARAAALLATEGASASLFARSALLGGLDPFISKNTLAAGDRKSLFLSVMMGAVAPLMLGGAALLFNGRAALLPLRRTAHLFAPLALAMALPALFSAHIWGKDPLVYIVLLAIVALVAERLLRLSLAAMPTYWFERAGELADRVPGSVRRALPLAIVTAAAAGYAGYMGYYSIICHKKLGTSGFDLGIYDNLMFNAEHGHPFRSPVLFGPKGGNYLAGHAEFGMLLFLPFYAIKPGSEVLLVIQAVMFGFAAVPLYLFATTQVPRPTAVIVALAYLLYAPLHGPNFYDFHWLPCAMFFHFWLYFAIATRRTWLITAMLLVLFSIREDVGVGTAVLGLFLMLTGARPGLGAVMAVVSVAWFVIDKFVIMKWAGDWWFSEMYKDLIATGESGYGSVVRTILINPVFFLSTLLKQAKFEYFLQMFAPLAFLPVRRLPLALLAIPGFFFTLMTTEYGPTVSISFQYTTHWIPYLFAASILSLRLMTLDEGGVLKRRAALGAMCLALTSQSYGFGALLSPSSFVGGFSRIEFRYPEADQKRYAELKSLIALIPQSAAVAATEHVCPHISTRMTAYTLTGHHGDADYLLIQREHIGTGNTRSVVKDAFSRNPYGLVGQTRDFYLFKRDHESPDTGAARSALGV
jgi:uncharacterized membrane protein